ncbi:MAG: TlpA family protein disulfide reductase [Desulfomonile tiedjei]|uniref:TlpA family protein disulfide reductase n=1 Tax=Desulfomonile tiedjei TaxID=2358 RepID=A0A9D6UZC0_9BACT|nr:TlpA family protein disulfide reductase [Desulfomonile tiedjei]
MLARKKSVLSALLLMLVSAFLFWGSGQVLGAGGPKGTDFHVFKNPPPASNFQMSTVDGRVVNLADYKGKVVLLNFWRKDCPYCDMEKNQFSAMLKSFNNGDIKVLCANLWDDPSWVRAHATRYAGPFTIVTRAGGRKSVVENVVNGRTMGYYVVNGSNEAIYEVKGFPSTYVIDKQGRVVATHMGLAKWSVPAVMRWLADLLGEQGTGTSVEPGSDLPEWLHHLLGGNPGRKISERIASFALGDTTD